MRCLFPVLTIAIGLLAGVDQPSARAEESPSDAPMLQESLESGVYRLQGSFAVSASAHVVWQVLTDFEGMPHFVASIRSSIPATLPDGGLIVAQEFEGKAFIFTRKFNVRLVVQEEPEHRITFRDVALRDFDSYDGSWQIQRSGVGSKVIYQLTAEPRETVPGVLGRGAFKDGAAQMLVELRNEMVRRSEQSANSTWNQ